MVNGCKIKAYHLSLHSEIEKEVMEEKREEVEEERRGGERRARYIHIS
jgi:hypothetical protein